jgi:hypothetical protein
MGPGSGFGPAAGGEDGLDEGLRHVLRDLVAGRRLGERNGLPEGAQVRLAGGAHVQVPLELGARARRKLVIEVAPDEVDQLLARDVSLARQNDLLLRSMPELTPR